MKQVNDILGNRPGLQLKITIKKAYMLEAEECGF